MRLQYLVGFGRVNGLESRGVRRLGKFFEYLAILVAVALLLQWHFVAVNRMSPPQLTAVNWSIWSYFVVQWLLLTALVSDKPRYWRHNWFILFAIIYETPLLLGLQYHWPSYQNGRLLLTFVMIMPWFGLIKRSLTDDRLGTTLLTVFFSVVIAGFVVSGFDPGIKSLQQGIWWAWVTMSTVGYGDIVPLSWVGRLIGSAVILIGLCFFAVLTANFSSLFVRRQVGRFRDQERRDMRRIIKRIDQVESRDEEILQLLQQLSERLKKLEDDR